MNSIRRFGAALVRGALTSILLMAVVAGNSAVGKVAPRTSRPVGGPNDRVVPGVVIVKVKAAHSLGKAGANAATALARVQDAGALQVSAMFPLRPSAASTIAAAYVTAGLDRIYVATIAPSDDPRVMAGRFAALEDVEYAEPKYLQTLCDAPNDSLFSIRQLAYLTRMQVTDAWGVVKADSVVVADVDGGTFWQHPDIMPNLWMNTTEDVNGNHQFDMSAAPAGDLDGVDNDADGYVDDVIGWNFANNTDDPTGLVATPQSAAHGTATASVVGAATNNVNGMAGSAWNCRLMVINAADPTTDNSIQFGYEGIVFAFSHGARVINCSWGRLGTYSAFEQDVITSAVNAGALVVAAAGNYSVDCDVQPHWPGSLKGCLSVGAVGNTNDVLASFSDFGVSIPVYAPGISIWGALVNGSFNGTLNGTSFSSPLAAGLAAMLFSEHPSWTPTQVATQMRVSSDNIHVANPSYIDGLGHGRLNFYAAVSGTYPGLNVVSSNAVSASGRPYIKTGDTVYLFLTVENVLVSPATNVNFQLNSFSGSLRVVSGTATVASVAPGGQATLSPMILVADTVTNSRSVPLALYWTGDGGYRDEAMVSAIVYSGPPVWNVATTPADGVSPIYAVRAVSTQIVWATGNVPGPVPFVIRSVDGGTTWNDVTGDMPAVAPYCMEAIDSLHAWVGTGSGKIYVTTNGGVHWSIQTYPARLSPFMDGIRFFTPLKGIAMGDPPGSGDNKFIVLQTTDGGATWTHSAGEPTGVTSAAGWANSWDWIDENTGWFGSNVNAIWRTTDGGTTWSAAASGATNSNGVSFSDALHGVAVHDNGVVSYSSDGGSSWNAEPAISTYLTGVVAPKGTSSSWVMALSFPFESNDFGHTWSQKNTYPFNGAIYAVDAVDSTHIWAGTSYGQVLAYAPQNATGVGEPATAVPASYVLAQNYPNPFNPQTRIEFVLPRMTTVQLEVYNLLGQRVQVLVNGVLSAGKHTVTFDGAGHASGVYFYRLKTGESMLVRKMVLLR